MREGEKDYAKRLDRFDVSSDAKFGNITYHSRLLYNVRSLMCDIFMIIPPTSKKLRGILLSGCVGIHLSVHPLRFLMHAISYEPYELVLKFHIWILHGK